MNKKNIVRIFSFLFNFLKSFQKVEYLRRSTMSEGEHPINDPDHTPHNFAFMTRIPEHIFSQIQEGYSIRINPKNRNEPQFFDLINEKGEKVGDFQSNFEDVKNSEFDSILKANGESYTPILPIPPDFSFKTHHSHVIEIKEHTKKHSNMSQDIQIMKNLRNDGTDIFRDWSPKKAYDSLLAMKHRFEKSKKSIYSLLDEFQTALNSNPQILSNSSILQNVSSDVNAYLNDMRLVTQFTDNFANTNQHQLKM